MKIAATINNNNYIDKLPDGPYIFIYDSNNKKIEKNINPGFSLKENRRSAVVDFLISKRVDCVITVPEAFCSISYEKAKKNGIKFIKLNKSMPYKNVLDNIALYINNITDEIPEEELNK